MPTWVLNLEWSCTVTNEELNFRGSTPPHPRKRGHIEPKFVKNTSHSIAKKTLKNIGVKLTLSWLTYHGRTDRSPIPIPKIFMRNIYVPTVRISSALYARLIDNNQTSPHPYIRGRCYKGTYRLLRAVTYCGSVIIITDCIYLQSVHNIKFINNPCWSLQTNHPHTICS